MVSATKTSTIANSQQRTCVNYLIISILQKTHLAIIHSSDQHHTPVLPKMKDIVLPAELCPVLNGAEPIRYEDWHIMPYNVKPSLLGAGSFAEVFEITLHESRKPLYSTMKLSFVLCTSTLHPNSKPRTTMSRANLTLNLH